MLLPINVYFIESVINNRTKQAAHAFAWVACFFITNLTDELHF